MSTDSIVEDLWKRIQNRDSLPLPSALADAGHQLLRPRLDISDAVRAKYILRSLAGGFGNDIEIARADPDDPRLVSVWAAVSQPQPPIVALAVQTR